MCAMTCQTSVSQVRSGQVQMFDLIYIFLAAVLVQVQDSNLSLSQFELNWPSQAFRCYPTDSMDSASDVSVKKQSAASIRTMKRLQVAMKLLAEFQAQNLPCPPDLFQNIKDDVPKRTWERTAGTARHMLKQVAPTQETPGD